MLSRTESNKIFNQVVKAVREGNHDNPYEDGTEQYEFYDEAYEMVSSVDPDRREFILTMMAIADGWSIDNDRGRGGLN
jgi:hypothetical protein